MILEAMRERRRIGIGRLVLNTRERICAVEPRDHRMLLTTLRTDGDIVTASDVGGIARLPTPDHSGDGLGGRSPGDSNAITARTLSRMVLQAC